MLFPGWRGRKICNSFSAIAGILGPLSPRQSHIIRYRCLGRRMLSPLWGMTGPVTLNFVQKRDSAALRGRGRHCQGWRTRGNVLLRCRAYEFVDIAFVHQGYSGIDKGWDRRRCIRSKISRERFEGVVMQIIQGLEAE
jgi:hypothetical protein